jgi:hypothetical protein
MKHVVEIQADQSFTGPNHFEEVPASAPDKMVYMVPATGLFSSKPNLENFKKVNRKVVTIFILFDSARMVL